MSFIHTHIPQLLHQYGSLTIFIFLAFGIVGLPIPDETLLLLGGLLAAKGQLSIISTIIAAICGSCIGITVSYILGRFIGHTTLICFGKYIGLTEKKLELAHHWFEKFGKYLLFFGYFIPGVRHFTGITAGATELNYRSFAIFAYLGAIAWSLTFISIGYFFFHAWERLHVF